MQTVSPASETFFELKCFSSVLPPLCSQVLAVDATFAEQSLT